MIRPVALGLVLALSAPSRDAYIDPTYPLKSLLKDATVIAEGKIDSVDTEKQTAVLKIERSLKGKCAFTHILMNIGVGQAWHPKALQRHLVVGAPVIHFYNKAQQGETYLNRFFFQLFGSGAEPPDKGVWNFTHIEIGMNRTFNGTVAELSGLVRKVLAGSATAPAPNRRRPRIKRADLDAIPAPLEATDGKAELPASFLETGIARKPDPKTTNATFPVHDEGFIRHWLWLGPIYPGEGVSEQTEAVLKPVFSREWFPKPAEARPRDLDTVTVGGTKFAWDRIEAEGFALDFGRAQHLLNYALAYVIADAELSGLTLLTGSQDSAVWTLNGKEVQRVYAQREVQKDQDRSRPVTLKKGVNVLLVAVVNRSEGSGCCARFVDAAGKPVTSIRISRSPTPDAPK